MSDDNSNYGKPARITRPRLTEVHGISDVRMVIAENESIQPQSDKIATAYKPGLSLAQQGWAKYSTFNKASDTTKSR